MREDPSQEGLLYAGTEFGIFVSFDNGAHWQSLQKNLPSTPVTDIRVHRKDLVLSTMGRAFWIMDNLTPLHQLALRHQMVMTTEAYLFQPREAYRMRYAPTDALPGRPEYPPPGAQIDYYLAGEPSSDVTIEITDGKGATVRTLTSRQPVSDAASAGGGPSTGQGKAERRPAGAAAETALAQPRALGSSLRRPCRFAGAARRARHLPGPAVGGRVVTVADRSRCGSTRASPRRASRRPTCRNSSTCS